MVRAAGRAATAGVLAGVRLAAKSYEPSLMARSAVDQGLVAGGSFLTGFVSAATVSAAFDVLPDFATTRLLKVSGIAVAGARTMQSISDPDEADSRDAEKSAWIEFGTEIISSVALARLVTGDASKLTSFAALGAYGLATTVDASTALELRTDQPDAKYLGTSAAVAAGANLAVVGLVGAVRFGGWLPSRLVRTRPVLRTLVRLSGSAVAAGAMSRAVGAAASDAFGKIAEANRATEIAYADPPLSFHVSGGPASEVPYDTLGVQGRRLVSEVTSAKDIAAVMGTDAVSEPVRVYIGVDSEDSDEALVAAAISEMRRLGGFDRSTIIAAAPAGTGYVNYIAVEAAELMSLGDCATVAIQYGSLPSMLSLNKVGRASRLYAALLSALRDEIDATGADSTLVAYGESLGAAAGQAGVEEASDGEQLIVDRGLWVGTPMGSPLFERLTGSGIPVFDSPDDLGAWLEATMAPAYIFLNHDNDPVTKFSVSDLYQMPAWLRERDRGRGTNPAQRWLPGVSFFQGLIDTKNAATVIPGEFFSTGHDYRADLASFVRTAFGFDAVSQTQMDAIEARLRASELARSEGIALGKLQTA